MRAEAGSRLRRGSRLRARAHPGSRLRARARSTRGQSTVEFAIVTAGFLAATIALGTIWHAFGDGILVDHALAVASHHIQAVAPTTVADIFLY